MEESRKFLVAYRGASYSNWSAARSCPALSARDKDYRWRKRLLRQYIAAESARCEVTVRGAVLKPSVLTAELLSVLRRT